MRLGGLVMKYNEGNILLNNKFFAFTDDYVKDIKNILKESRSKTYKAVNSMMIQTNWLIGYRIVEQEQKGKERADYGSKIIENLSRELNKEFGSGMSVAQLWNCRQFYLVFRDEEILYTLCRELSWSHIRLIMRLDTESERIYYINEAKQGNWSVRELERNIKTDMYHRVVKNQLPMENSRNKTSTFIKDPYILEFLGVKPETKVNEKDIENAIITHLEKFLLEIGKGFSFVERQMHIKTETQDFYIDLVFYNYLLKCFVIIDLKQGTLKHQDIGQMDMYVRMFDSLKKSEDDNPTIGLILCQDKDESIVRYSVLSESEQIFASKYKTILPTEEELKNEIDRNRRFLFERQNTIENDGVEHGID